MDRHLEELSSLTLPPNTELIAVVGGQDDTYDVYADWCEDQSMFDRARCLRQQPSDGYEGAIERGLLAAQGEYVLHLEMDTEIEQNWAVAMVSALQRHDAVSCKGKPRNGVSLHWAYQWVDHHRAIAEGSPQLSGARTMGFRRQVVEDVLLDEPLPSNLVDWRIYNRITDAGYSTGVVDTSIVEVSHVEEHTSFSHFLKMQRNSLAGLRGRDLLGQALKFLLVSVASLLVLWTGITQNRGRTRSRPPLLVPFAFVAVAVGLRDLNDVRVASRADRKAWVIAPLYILSKQLLYVARTITAFRQLLREARNDTE